MSTELALLEAEVHYYRDRLSLLRAKRYRWGLGSNARSQELERRLELAEQRLRERVVVLERRFTRARSRRAAAKPLSRYLLR